MQSKVAAGYLLHSEEQLLEVAALAVSHSRHLGVAAASAQASENAGTTIKVRNRQPLSLVRDGGHSVSITVFDGGRSGHASTQATDPQSVRRAVEQAVAIARQVEADPDGGLPDPAWLARTGPGVPLFAPSGRSASDLTAIALHIEASAQEQSQGMPADLRINEAAAASADMRWARVASDGFARAGSASMQSRACVAIARAGDGMTSDWSTTMARQESDLEDPATIAGDAVQRAVRKLGARGLPTQTSPVLLDARIAASLVSDLIGGLSGNAQQQRSTFLVDSMGSQRLAVHLDLVEDPFAPYGLSSFAWDGEGVGPSRRHIVRDGVIEGYFLNARNARKLGTRSTGNADGPGNLELISRHCTADDDLGAMLRKLHRGLWITSFYGGQVNGATGSYSKAVDGFWVENGEVVHPVRDVTIAGQLQTMLEGIVAVGADQYAQGAIRTGSILLESMRIAGR